MNNTEFNLLDEPWVIALTPEWEEKPISLTDVLLHAHEYLDLCGETQTQNFAVLRVLLSVLHTILTRYDESGIEAPISTPKQAISRWESIWKLGHFPEKPIREYCQKWHDRFWLFHPTHPFFQVPEAAIGTRYSSAKLIGELCESGNKKRHFSSYAGTNKTQLSYAQAARWLINLNGYDDTSAKPKGKGLPSSKAGRLGKLGAIQAVGDNLFETLMLNLTLLKDGEYVWGQDHPCWELDKPRSAERVEITEPDNQAEILTLQSRRILLFREDGFVTGYALLGGDRYSYENAFGEQMTIWREVPGKKKDDPVIYKPLQHSSGATLWKEFPTIFFQGAHKHQPGIVQWISRIQRSPGKCLQGRSMIHFRIAAIGYGDKDFVVNDYFSDSLGFDLALLDNANTFLQLRIADEVNCCKKLAQIVGQLASDLYAAQTGRTDNQKGRERAQALFYSMIDKPFRYWISDLDATWDHEKLEQYLELWEKQATRITRDLGVQLAEKAGPAAYVGHMVTPQSGKKPIRYCSPKVMLFFYRRISDVYPKICELTEKE